MILEKWFKTNSKNPYACLDIKKELANQTNLTVNQVSKWLLNARFKMKKNNLKTTNRISIENKKLLKDFFANKNQHPNRKQLKELKNITKIHEKKIMSWFAKQRYLTRSKNI
jgi:succinate dehydrogenase flavin-adding protein (antitoxin of CptAB toxin-antitoxin module)